MSAPAASSQYSKENPFPARITENRLNRSMPAWIAAKPLSEVTMADIKQVHAEVGTTRKGEANTLASTIRTILAFSKEKGWIAESPCTGLRMEKFAAQRGKKALTRDEYRRVFQVLRDRQAKEDRIQWLALEAIALTGGRKMEMLTLREDEVDLDAMLITKTEHKTANRVGAKALVIHADLLAPA